MNGTIFSGIECYAQLSVKLTGENFQQNPSKNSNTYTEFFGPRTKLQWQQYDGNYNFVHQIKHDFILILYDPSNVNYMAKKRTKILIQELKNAFSQHFN